MDKEKEIQRELFMLRSGMLGKNIDLDMFVDEGLITLEAAKIYLEELGASSADIGNRGKLLIAIEKYHAAIR